MAEASNDPEAEDRRQFLRIPAQVRIKYRVVPSQDMRVSITMELGGGGLSLLMPKPPERGAFVAVELMLPTGVVRCSAQVAWADPKPVAGDLYRVGLTIIEIGEKEHRMLSRYCLSPDRSAHAPKGGHEL
jgi:c-di-GMP-binding flagellar brake protein YcgR